MPSHYDQTQGGATLPTPAEEPLSPEEQQVYDAVVKRIGNQSLYSDKGADAVLKMVQTHEDPVQGISETAVALVSQEDERMDGAMPDTVVIPAAVEIAEHISELVNEAGLAKIDDAVLQEVGKYVIAEAGDTYDQTPEDMEEALGGSPHVCAGW